MWNWLKRPTQRAADPSESTSIMRWVGRAFFEHVPGRSDDLSRIWSRTSIYFRHSICKSAVGIRQIKGGSSQQSWYYGFVPKLFFYTQLTHSCCKLQWIIWSQRLVRNGCTNSSRLFIPIFCSAATICSGASLATMCICSCSARFFVS